MRVEVRENEFAKQPWHYVIIADNEQVELTSENYERRIDCVEQAQQEATLRGCQLTFGT